MGESLRNIELLKVIVLTLPLLQTCASEMDDASLSILIRRYPWSIISPLPTDSLNVSGIFIFLLDALVRWLSCEKLVAL